MHKCVETVINSLLFEILQDIFFVYYFQSNLQEVKVN